MTDWIPILRYRPFNGWVIIFECGHRRYILNAMLIEQPWLLCYQCACPREVTRCLKIAANLTF